VRFGNFAYDHITGSGRHGSVVFSQKLAFPLKNYQAQLTLDVMTMHGQFLSGFEVKIDDFKIGGIVHQQFFKRLFRKIIFFIKVDMFHFWLLSHRFRPFFPIELF
jgi:hypothetical protein